MPSDTLPTGRRPALMQMIAIAAPSVVTMSSYTAMQFMDRLMVKEIGPEPVYVAAMGMAGITTWMMMTFCVGLTGVVSSFVSQNFGAGKPERGSAYAWNSMWIGLAYWGAIMLPATLAAPWIFSKFPAEDAVRALAVDYGIIAFSGSLFTLLAKGLHNYFFGLHRPGVVMVAVVAANLTNIFLNLVLIFGPNGLALGPAPEGVLSVIWPVFATAASAAAWVAQTLGLPAMGLRGAALATVLGNVVELAIPLAVFLSARYARELGTRAAWRPRRRMVADLARVGWPAGLMFLNDLVTWNYMMSFLTPKGAGIAVAHAGGDSAAQEAAQTAAATAGFIALQWMHLSFMPAVGISIATQAMVGKAVGARDPDRAASHTWLGLKLTVGYMGLCALAFLLFRRDLIGVFINEATPAEQAAGILLLGAQIMVAAAVFQVFDAVAITISAALRGAGDTIWPGAAALVSSWVCIVGLGHLLLWARPELGGLAAWVGAAGYIIALGVVLLIRFMNGKWRSIRLVNDEPIRHLPPDEVLPPGPNPEVG